MTLSISQDELRQCRQKLKGMAPATQVAPVVGQINVKLRVDDAPIQAALVELLAAASQSTLPEPVVKVLLDAPGQLLQLTTDGAVGPEGDLVVQIGPGLGLAALLRILRGDVGVNDVSSAEPSAGDLLDWLGLACKFLDPKTGGLSIRERLSIGVDPWKYGEAGDEVLKARFAAVLGELGGQFQQCRVELALSQLAVSNQLGDNKGE